MSILNSLRCIDPQKFGNLRARLSYFGYQPQENWLPSDKLFLRFNAEFVDDSEMTGYIDRTSWLKISMPDLVGIDWQSVDEDILPSLIADFPLHLDLTYQHSPIKQCQIVELVRDTTQLYSLPSLPIKSGSVLVERFVFQSSIDRPDLSIDLERNLTVPIVFHIGRSRLPLAALSATNVGDVLLIEQITGDVKSIGKTFLNFILKQDSIMIMEKSEEQLSEDLQPKLQGVCGTTGKERLSELPVELSFVLFEKTVQLGELKSILPGETLQLPTNVLMDVEIRANHKCFAKGELVQLPNNQLAVEVRKIWP